MAYKITDECISCGACEMECPNSAISEGETQYGIDSAKCTECVGSFDFAQCVDICPVEAVVLDPDHEESRDDLIEKWKTLHPGEEPKLD